MEIGYWPVFRPVWRWVEDMLAYRAPCVHCVRLWMNRRSIYSWNVVLFSEFGVAFGCGAGFPGMNFYLSPIYSSWRISILVPSGRRRWLEAFLWLRVGLFGRSATRKIFNGAKSRVIDIVALVKALTFFWFNHRTRCKKADWNVWVKYPLYCL